MEKQYKLYRNPKYGQIYGEQIRTPEGTFVWVWLAKPKDPPPPKPGEEQKGGPRYEVSIFFPKEGKQAKDFIEQMKPMSDQMVSLYNQHAKAKLGGVEFLQDGDAFDHEKYPWLKGQYVLQARYSPQANKPLEFKILDNATPKNTLSADAIFGGQEGVLVVTPLLTSHGISYKLAIVQLRKDTGLRIGGFSMGESLLDDEGEEVPTSQGKINTQEGLNAAMNKL